MQPCSLRLVLSVTFIVLTMSSQIDAQLLDTSSRVILGTELFRLEPNVDLAGLDLALLNARGNLRGASFAGSNLTGSRFSANSDLVDVDFSGANLSEARLIGDITGANFTGADISGATLKGISRQQLESTESFQNQNLRGITITSGSGFFSPRRRVLMRNWDLSGQDLTSATLGSVDATGADFTNATIELATLSTGTFNQSRFANTNLSHSEWIFSDARLADFTAADLRGADMRSINMPRATLTGANLYGASLFSANLELADLRDANLLSADLRGANLSGANFANTNIQNTSLEYASSLASATFDETTRANQWTVFPDEFDPVAAGLTIIQSPLGDFDASGTVDFEDVGLLEARLSRGTDPVEQIQIRDNIAFFVNPTLSTIDFLRFPDSGVQGNVFVAEERDDVGLDDVRRIFQFPEGLEFSLLHTDDLALYLALRRKVSSDNDEWLELMFDVNEDGLVNATDLEFVQALADVAARETASRCVVFAGDILGDLDEDGEVTFSDFLIIAGNFGRTDIGYQGGDLNCDETVDFDDFLDLASNFGRTVNDPQAVPEPSGVVILLFGIAFPLLHRHSRTTLRTETYRGTRHSSSSLRASHESEDSGIVCHQNIRPNDVWQEGWTLLFFGVERLRRP